MMELLIAVSDGEIIFDGREITSPLSCFLFFPVNIFLFRDNILRA